MLAAGKQLALHHGLKWRWWLKEPRCSARRGRTLYFCCRRLEELAGNCVYNGLARKKESLFAVQPEKSGSAGCHHMTPGALLCSEAWMQRRSQDESVDRRTQPSDRQEMRIFVSSLAIYISYICFYFCSPFKCISTFPISVIRTRQHYLI